MNNLDRQLLTDIQAADQLFQVIDSPDELPQIPCTVISLDMDLMSARMYATTTGRKVYFIRSKDLAVWFQPFRRRSEREIYPSIFLLSQDACQHPPEAQDYSVAWLPARASRPGHLPSGESTGVMVCSLCGKVRVVAGAK